MKKITNFITLKYTYYFSYLNKQFLHDIFNILCSLFLSVKPILLLFDAPPNTLSLSIFRFPLDQPAVVS
jgi:hypothetical protein